MSDARDYLDPDMLSAYLDGELDADERAAVEARLAESPEWRAELDEVRAARACGALPVANAPAGFWDAVLAARRGRCRGRSARPTAARRW